MKITKRNCTEVDFESKKIYDAIMSAMTNGSGIVKPSVAQEITDEIAETASKMDDLSVHTIESMVFDKLCEKGETQTARAYEGYRSVREFQRDVRNSTDDTIMEMLLGTSEYWNEENSNKNAMLVTTQRDYMAGIESEDITRRMLLTPDIIQAHDEGIIHFHDADYFAQPFLFAACTTHLLQGICGNPAHIRRVHVLLEYGYYLIVIHNVRGLKQFDVRVFECEVG